MENSAGVGGLVLISLFIWSLNAFSQEMPVKTPWFQSTLEDHSVMASTLPDPALVESAEPALRRWVDAMAKMPSPCETDVLLFLQKSIESAGIQATPETVKASIRWIREHELMDDLSLSPLLWVMDALDTETELFPFATVRAMKLQVDMKEGTFLPESRCVTDSFFETLNQVRLYFPGRAILRRHHVKAYLKHYAQTGLLSATRIKVFLQLYDAQYFNKSRSLGQIFVTASSVRDNNRKLPMRPGRSKFLTHRLSKGLTRREQFYQTFSSIQINRLAEFFDQYKKGTRVADRFAVMVDYHDGTHETFEVNPLGTNEAPLPAPMEQNHFFANRLRQNLERAPLSKLFEGTTPTFEDAVVAALETGLIDPDEERDAIAIADYWVKHKSLLRKIVDVVRRYGAPAFIFIPSPFNVLVTSGILLTDFFTKGDDLEHQNTLFR